MKRAIFALALLALGASSFAVAAPVKAPPLSGKPGPTETAFVTGIQKDLTARFPTAADAEKAGYVRFTNEDSTGAISYANLEWKSADPQHPSQLWYDVNGQLLGADFSVPLAESATAPKLWGINPKRWDKFGRPHVHYILKNADGSLTYGAFHAAQFTTAGGDIANPQAATVVKLGKAKAETDVVKVFTFPALWDLIVWVKPNPLGAFAEKNPNVKPSANAKTGDM